MCKFTNYDQLKSNEKMVKQGKKSVYKWVDRKEKEVDFLNYM